MLVYLQWKSPATAVMGLSLAKLLFPNVKRAPVSDDKWVILDNLDETIAMCRMLRQ